MLAKQSDIPAAMFREDVGDVMFPYGRPGSAGKKFEDGFGISHIIARRNLDGVDGERFVRETLPEIVARGQL